MKNIIYSTSSVEHTLEISDVANIKLQLGVCVFFTHVILLFLVSAEHADFFDIGIEKPFQHSITKRPGATGDQKR
ncbi:hypothetical protein D3C76_1598390 [compost metagenome]